MKTLQELQEDDKLDYGIEYIDGCELDDSFIEMQIVNPENEGKLIYSWVPASMEQKLKDEKELASTNRYYDWTSTFTDFCNRNEAEIEEEEVEEKAKEIITEWNNTTLGARYPMNIEDIEFDGGRITIIKSFD